MSRILAPPLEETSHRDALIVLDLLGSFFQCSVERNMRQKPVGYERKPLHSRISSVLSLKKTNQPKASAMFQDLPPCL